MMGPEITDYRIHKISFANDGTVRLPVSYTHLDVYKRQSDYSIHFN